MDVCACGCGTKLVGKQVKWFNDEHKNDFNTRARREASERLSRALNDTPTVVPAYFHNTVNLGGAALTEANQKASKQEDAILEFFNTHLGMYTPCEVGAEFPQWPITSVRRSITNLTKRGKLVKTSVKRQGQYGAVNFCWTAA